MPRPTLSVVLPNYNHARYLPDAIGEILHQSRPPDEFLILDDASSDDSLEIIESFAAKHDVITVLRNETNAGVNAAHRRLFEAASCDYIYAGAADDRRFPRFFELALDLAARHPQAGLICGRMAVFDEADNELGEICIRKWDNETPPRFDGEPGAYAPPDRVLADYLDVEAPSHSLCGATVYRREALKEVGWYRDELDFWGDTFSARAVALKHGLCYIPERVAGFRRLPGSFSADGRSDPRKMLDVIANAAALMRSDEFADRFPPAHVQRWERRFRRLVAWNAWLGEGVGFRPFRPAFWWRVLRRLPHLPAALNLSRYRSEE